MMAPASAYIKAFNWAEKNRLDHLYPAGTLPAYVAEGIDLVSSTMYRIHEQEMEKLRKERK